jgi:C4-type Zn-finger protein
MSKKKKAKFSSILKGPTVCPGCGTRLTLTMASADVDTLEVIHQRTVCYNCGYRYEYHNGKETIHEPSGSELA